MPKILIIFGSTREGRNGEPAAKWIHRLAATRKDFEVEYLDLRDWPLPFFNDPNSPMLGTYPSGLVTEWAQKIAAADGFIIVTPEYNHGYPAVLKNALDHLYAEWNNKPVAFVGYGGAGGGIRCVEQLRGVVVELQMAPIREAVHIQFIWEAFDDAGNPKNPSLEKKAQATFDQLIWWAEALKVARRASVA